MEEEMKGDLEIIVNYMNEGLLKTRIKDVKDAELPVVLRDGFLALLKTILQAKGGEFPDNAMPLFSKEQLEKI